MNEAKRIDPAAYRGRIGHLQEFLSSIGTCTHRSLDISIEHLRRHIIQELLGCIQ